MENLQPQYKISGKKRQELKFVVDCMKRIYKYYHDEENGNITEPHNADFTTYLYYETEMLQEKLNEKFV
jgi:hypothetical protein